MNLRSYTSNVMKWTEPSHWNSNTEPYISLIFAQGLVIHVSHWGFTVKDPEPE